MNLVWAIGATLVVSLVSLVGVFSLMLNEKILNRALILLIALSAGALIGGALFHLLPEAFEHLSVPLVFGSCILGFSAFFVLEKYLYWHHCHNGVCDVHIFTYLNLIGDGIHNLIDGIMIGASFNAGIHFGIVTTVAVIFHEIPQEIGDFGVLVYGGFHRFKALAFNFICALGAVLGALIGYYFSRQAGQFSLFILPFAAGGFLYISTCDLIPELRKHGPFKRANLSVAFFLFGLLIMWVMKFFFHNH
ncbi:MAG: ZIP family metal transporter [Candidatus Omnitrophica bacterium]|nr:ZIP family metal transporter [Candidatus Omnitrophota bacterium]